MGYPIFIQRVMGIEPTCSAWKADILPLNYTRVSFGDVSLTTKAILQYEFCFVKCFLCFLGVFLFVVGFF